LQTERAQTRDHPVVRLGGTRAGCASANMVAVHVERELFASALSSREIVVAEERGGHGDFLGGEESLPNRWAKHRISAVVGRDSLDLKGVTRLRFSLGPTGCRSAKREGLSDRRVGPGRMQIMWARGHSEKRETSICEREGFVY